MGLLFDLFLLLLEELLEFFYLVEPFLDIGDIPVSVLFEEIVLELVDLLLVQEHVSLALGDDDLVVILDGLPSLARDNVEQLLTVGPEVIGQHHHGIQKLRLVVLHGDEIVETREHVFVLMENAFDEELGQKSQNESFLVELFVGSLDGREVRVGGGCFVGFDSFHNDKSVEILINLVQLTTDLDNKLLRL